MTDKVVPEIPEQVACEICMKEIPSSAAHTMEAEDYVYHFCGIDCYDKWKHQENKTEE